MGRQGGGDELGQGGLGGKEGAGLIDDLQEATVGRGGPVAVL